MKQETEQEMPVWIVEVPFSRFPLLAPCQRVEKLPLGASLLFGCAGGGRRGGGSPLISWRKGERGAFLFRFARGDTWLSSPGFLPSAGPSRSTSSSCCCCCCCVASQIGSKKNSCLKYMYFFLPVSAVEVALAFQTFVSSLLKEFLKLFHFRCRSAAGRKGENQPWRCGGFWLLITVFYDNRAI